MKKKRYKNFNIVVPKDLEPIEYVIEMQCIGWYSPTDEAHHFIPDERTQPLATVTRWRRRSGPSYAEAAPAIEEFKKGIYKKVE